MKFFRAVEECFQLIRREPEFQERIRGDYRRAIVRRYPYAVIYQFVPDQNLVKIYTVFHCSQDPAKLIERLPPSAD
jgi:plasmid stabilization system protein ParE